MHDVIRLTSHLHALSLYVDSPGSGELARIQIMNQEILDGFSESDSYDSDSSGNYPLHKESAISEQNRGFYPPTDLLRKCVLERQPSLIRSNSRGSFSASPRKKSDVIPFGAPLRRSKKKETLLVSDGGKRSPEGCMSGECLVDFSESDDFRPFIAGQCSDDVDLPIMSPPCVELEHGALKQSEIQDLKYRFSRSLALKLLNESDDKLPKCGFLSDAYKTALINLEQASEAPSNYSCNCVSYQKVEYDFFSGWVNPYHNGKLNNGKRRKFSKPVSSASAFGRLTGAPSCKPDPLGYQHYLDINKYIERYRFLHTVGKVAGNYTNVKMPRNASDGDLYFLRMKAKLSEMASSYDLISLLATQARSPLSYPVCSENSDQGDDNPEDSIFDKSMKDRGKALNLTPVREFSNPCFSQEQLENFRENCKALNQYLNLMTPPLPVNCLQLELDETKARRLGNRNVNPSENNLFPACTPRRGARPLRLGSADFMKPGTVQARDFRWSVDKKTAHEPSSQTGTVPGTLIVGSTVCQQNHSAPNAARVKDTGHRSPYVQYQKEKHNRGPHQISGKKFEPSERSVEISNSAKARLSYTQAPRVMSPPMTSDSMASPNSIQSPCRTATMFDLQDPYMLPRREKIKTITLDVNHLGIRGQPLRHEDSVTIPYRGSRRTSVNT